MKCLVYSFFSLLIILTHSCTTANIFGSKNPRQQYADGLEQAGLQQSVLGREWFSQSQKAIETSLAVNIPYRENGYFAADVPRSAGIRLRPKQGQELIITVVVQPKTGARLFVELWKTTGNQNKPKLIMAADSSLTIRYEVDDDPELILTLQPELLAAVSYSLSVVAEPSLAFPVPGNSGKKVGSFWGDQRDGGSRKHEGIDIFDAFRTPLIAVEDGMVTRVGENGRGGKVIWLSPAGKDYNLYYAHLDEQLVTGMQRVQKGDTIGLMGNTGNARNTPSHLHFGIYTRKGAVDPLPFIQQVPQKTEPVKGVLLNTGARTNKKVNLLNTPAQKSVTITELKPGTFIHIEGAAGNYYKVIMPDETTGFLPLSAIEELNKPLRSSALKASSFFTIKPDSTTAVIKQINNATPVKILALFNNYIYTTIDGQNGWLRNEGLE